MTKNLIIWVLVSLLVIIVVFMIELAMICEDLEKQVNYYKELYQDQSIVVRVLQESCGVE